MYLIIAFFSLIISALICWIIDQQLCERMNDVGGFNPQLHGWWDVISALDCHFEIVCREAMRLLSIKYQQHQIKHVKSSTELFRPDYHLHIIFYCELSFIDYSDDEQMKEAKK
ncbi:unnamed protein product [Rotaria sp. Silwood2]|nr:unnamed protein product [Rotaria sp. Silwood2]CAF3342709.1 unnamed protein product [Rotaria sp. Silwood2]CAF4363898.1 unnamed protein product [Rotaria sp. Silwood2]CAF4466600.1 unnamed protein product [Rotaria sp. Silwood2]